MKLQMSKTAFVFLIAAGITSGQDKKLNTATIDELTAKELANAVKAALQLTKTAVR